MNEPGPVLPPSRAVTGFLELLGSQLLQSDSETPAGLQLHILELYLTELAAVGSAEVSHWTTADPSGFISYEKRVVLIGPDLVF